MAEPFTKFDSNKDQWHLLFHPLLIPALQALVRVLMHGARKYPSEDNWKHCDNPLRYWNASMRHRAADMGGEWNDPESGEPHLAHMIVSDLFRFALELREREQPKVPKWPRQDDE